MLISVIKAEFIKLRRSPIWIAFVTLPLLAAIMGTFNYQQNIGILSQKWYSLWSQHTIFSSFFFLPTLLGLLCAYEWRLEHSGNNWNSLMAQPITPFAIFVGKLIASSTFAIATLLFTGFLYYMSGRLVGLWGFPIELLAWLTFGILGAIVITAVQLLFSMVIKSFAIPVGISLVGGIIGLAMTSAGMWIICPYALLAVGMNSTTNGNMTSQNLLPYLISAASFIAISIFLAIWNLSHKDSSTN